MICYIITGFILLILLSLTLVKIKGGVSFKSWLQHTDTISIDDFEPKKFCFKHNSEMIKNLSLQVSEFVNRTSTSHNKITNILIVGNSLTLLAPLLAKKFNVIFIPLSLSTGKIRGLGNVDSKTELEVLKYYKEEIKRYPPDNKTGEEYRDYTLLIDYTQRGAMRKKMEISGWNDISKALNIKWNLLAYDINEFEKKGSQLPRPTMEEISNKTDRYMFIMLYPKDRNYYLYKKASGYYRIAPFYEPSLFNYNPHPSWDKIPPIPNNDFWVTKKAKSIWDIEDVYIEEKEKTQEGYDPYGNNQISANIKKCISDLNKIDWDTIEGKVNINPIITGHSQDPKTDLRFIPYIYDTETDLNSIYPGLQNIIDRELIPGYTHIYKGGQYMDVYKTGDAVTVINRPPNKPERRKIPSSDFAATTVS